MHFLISMLYYVYIDGAAGSKESSLSAAFDPPTPTFFHTMYRLNTEYSYTYVLRI